MAGWKMSCCKLFVSQLARYPREDVLHVTIKKNEHMCYLWILMACNCPGCGMSHNALFTYMYKNVFLHFPFWPVVTMRRKQACFLSSSPSQVRDEGFVSPNELTGCFV